MNVYVVIGQYNHVEHTLGAIESLRGQISMSNIIVVDGGASEDVEVLTRLPIILIREQQNLGYGHLVNVGVKRAEENGAEAVLILNNDVIVGDGMVQELAHDVKGLNFRGVVGPTMYDRHGHIWFSGGRRSTLRGNVYHQTSHGSRHLIHSTFLSGCAMMIPTRVVREVGYFDESYFMYYEDADFSSRCEALGVPLVTCGKARLTHLVGASDSTGNTYFRYAPANRLRWLRRYSPPALRPVVICVVVLNFMFKGLSMAMSRSRRPHARLMWTGIYSLLRNSARSWPFA